jgi:hypothetical protein
MEERHRYMSALMTTSRRYVTLEEKVNGLLGVHNEEHERKEPMMDANADVEMKVSPEPMDIDRPSAAAASSSSAAAARPSSSIPSIFHPSAVRSPSLVWVSSRGSDIYPPTMILSDLSQLDESNAEYELPSVFRRLTAEAEEGGWRVKPNAFFVSGTVETSACEVESAADVMAWKKQGGVSRHTAIEPARAQACPSDGCTLMMCPRVL